MFRCEEPGPPGAPTAVDFDRKQSAWCGGTEYFTVHAKQELQYEPGERDLDIGIDKEGN